MSKGIKINENTEMILAAALVVGALSFMFIMFFRKEKRKIHNIVDDLPVSSSCTSADRDFDAVDTIVVHQTASLCKGDKHPHDTARHHISGNGWCGIGYHIFITETGKIFQTRKLRTNSAHAGKGKNTKSIGVVICGDHRVADAPKNEQIVPKEQYRALSWTIAYLQKKYPHLTKVVSHGSLSASRTDPNLHMNELLNDVKKVRV